ncbi:MAG TPA: NAD(P)H-hydrate epimerase [Candidatus Micrarchaeaceae archaeon]|nr:NAD(P)H-hydrate epimerase [Candidatus Micrarchaeaceae archaeon]
MTLSASASAELARALDAAAVQSGVSLDALMAVASFQCAQLARTLLDSWPPAGPVAVLAGRGNNGGDALGCARHLAAGGTVVRAVVLGDLSDPESSYSRQALAANAAGVVVRSLTGGEAGPIARTLDGASLIVDGLLGTGSTGPPRGAVAGAVRCINAAAAPVLAIDLPSGLDATSGEVASECVRADWTLMLAIPKSGCLAAAAASVVGELWLADIGIPAGAYQRVGLSAPQFRAASMRRWVGH